MNDDRIELISHHHCALEDKCPEKLVIAFNNKDYHIHFYMNSGGRFVALTPMVGCKDVYGEGANWWQAANELMNKLLPRSRK